MNPWSVLTSFQSTYSIFSTQNLQAFRRRTKNFFRLPDFLSFLKSLRIAFS
jgi:hypothetical protein